MIEAPEAFCLAGQLNAVIRGKRITEVLASYTPHKFAFVTPGVDYTTRLSGKIIGNTYARGGMVEITVGDSMLVFSDGVNLSYLEPGADLPSKHQLLIGFDDQSCLVASVRMYGGLLCFPQGRPAGSLAPYYLSAKEKPQVLSDAFSALYFAGLIDQEPAQKKSAKAFLATGQTIPGLGNGVLQDILYEAHIHPKTKIGDLTPALREGLFVCIKNRMEEMCRLGGRDTETDLFGQPGGYHPYLSKNSSGEPCPRCGLVICKENYLGGSIYYCPSCQPR